MSYRVETVTGKTYEIHNPSELPPPNLVAKIAEPVIEMTILTPDRYLGPIFQLLDDRRGIQKKLEYIGAQRVLLDYLVPLNEVVFDFHNQLKSLSQGYASMDYEFQGFREGPLVKLDILINGEEVDALSLIVHEDKAYATGPVPGRKDEEGHPEAAVRGRPSGRHREAHHSPERR